MRYITIEEVEDFHDDLIVHTGGSHGIRDRGMLESAVNQPMLQFGGMDLYPDLVSKAAALGYFLISNHAFVDGNKRIGLAAMQAVLLRNKFELSVSDTELEEEILSVAAGERSLAEFSEWVRSHLVSFIGIIRSKQGRN
jgi:death on curing protein